MTETRTAPAADEAATDRTSFGRDVRRAVIWRSGSQIIAQMISWGSTLLVIRLLVPADYGLFAMTQTVLTFLTFLNGYGFAGALIQSETLEKREIRQAFGLLLTMNTGLAAIQLFSAPLVASYYGQPVIADMLRVQALIFLATPFIALPEVIMARRLDFRAQAYVNLATAMMGGVAALVLAWLDFGVWTLVYAPLIAFWTRAIGLSWQARLLVWPSFDFRGCGRVFAFGAAILGANLFWVVQTQSGVFIAGRLFAPHQIGLYSEALFLTQIFMTKFVPPLNDVAFPAYARIQSDIGAIRWSFLKAARLIMLVAAPIYCGMAATAEPLVVTLFGGGWVEIAPLVVVLALAMPFMTLQILFAPAVNALGRPGLTMQTAAAGAVIFTVTLLVGVRFGILGISTAWLVAAPLLLLVTIRLAHGVLGIGVVALARSIAPAVLSALAMGALVAAADRFAVAPLLRDWPLLRLLLLVALGAPLYAGMLRLIDPLAIPEVLALLKRRAPQPADS